MKKTTTLFLALLLQQKCVLAQYEGAIAINTLTDQEVFVVEGNDWIDSMGRSVSSIGDFNNDGIDDVVIGKPGNDFGRALVVFGNRNHPVSPIDLYNLDGGNGFRLRGNPGIGTSVSSAGDFNGDGIDDILVASAYTIDADNDNAIAYVLFGNNSPLLHYINLNQMSPTEGIKFNRPILDDNSDFRVSTAGDFNNDGFDDIMVSSTRSDISADNAGATYLIYGNNSLASEAIELDDINGDNGLSILGTVAGDNAGRSISHAGDFNGDQIDDILIGSDGDESSGHVYLIFGSNNPSHPLMLSNINGSNGIQFIGEADGAFAGYGISGKFDFNADGLDDIIIGSYGARPYNNFNAGKAYVVYGTVTAISSPFSVDSIDGSNGTEIRGLNAKGRFGRAVSSIGDFNGDKIDDIIIGAPASDVRGWSAIFYGKTSPPAIIDAWPLFKEDGFRIQSSGNYLNRFGDAVSSAGDFNNDGLADVIIGSWSEDVNLVDDVGRAYILYGNDTLFQSAFEAE